MERGCDEAAGSGEANENAAHELSFSRNSVGEFLALPSRSRPFESMVDEA
jgi:hypothetical protein